MPALGRVVTLTQMLVSILDVDFAEAAEPITVWLQVKALSEKVLRLKLA